MDLNAMRDEAYATSKSKGWYEKGRSDIPTNLCLIHSEVSEALEAWRETGDDGIAATEAMVRATGYYGAPGSKPEGVAIELADVVIRIGDLSTDRGIDLNRAVELCLPLDPEFGTPPEHPLGLNEIRDRAFSVRSDVLSVTRMLCNIHRPISAAHSQWETYGDKEVSNLGMFCGQPTLSRNKSAGRPSGVAAELAMTFLQVCLLCGAHRIDLNAAVRAKMAFNKTRAHRHGGKMV